MSEFERTPEPGNNGESSPFDFSALNAEPVDMGSPEFEPPRTEKRKWWESRPRGKKTAEKNADKKSRRAAELKPMPRGGLKPALAQMYTGLGIAFMPFDPGCGRVIIENADKCAESLDEWAKTNPAVRNALITLVSTSALGAVIMAHAPILMAVMMHHVPFLRERQEKMVGEFAEMMANGFPQTNGDENTE